MMKAFKYRLYPNAEQREFFSKTFGCSRFIYNHMLHDKIEHYKETKQMLKNTPAQYKGEHPWLKEVDSLALANAQLDLEKAYKNFFRDKSIGFPKFKSKKDNHRSYTTNNQKGTVSIENGHIKLPKLKLPVKIKEHRQIDGEIKSCTISQTPSGKYFVSMLVDCKVDKMPVLETKVGIDVGIKTFAVLSNQEVIENPKHLKKSEKRLAKLQKNLSRKEKGSKNRIKARLKVARLHEKISNQRIDFLHKETYKIIRDNQVVVLEDLKVKNMIKNHKLAKSIAEASWGKFRQLLEYKADWYGREVRIAPSNYASSQLCSCCGNQSSQTKDLSCRIYICPECGLVIDRDYNASLNLQKLAM